MNTKTIIQAAFLALTGSVLLLSASATAGVTIKPPIDEGHRFPLTVSLTLTENGEPKESSRPSAGGTVTTSTSKFITTKLSNKQIVDLAKEAGLISSVSGWSLSWITRTTITSENADAENFRWEGCFLSKTSGGVTEYVSMDGVFDANLWETVEAESSTETTYPDESYSEKETESKQGFAELSIGGGEEEGYNYAQEGSDSIYCRGVAKWTVTDTEQTDAEGNWVYTELPSAFKISSMSGSFYDYVQESYEPVDPAADYLYEDEYSGIQYYYSEYDDETYYSVDGGETFYLEEYVGTMIEGTMSVSKSVPIKFDSLPAELYEEYVNYYQE